MVSSRCQPSGDIIGPMSRFVVMSTMAEPLRGEWPSAPQPSRPAPLANALLPLNPWDSKLWHQESAAAPLAPDWSTTRCTAALNTPKPRPRSPWRTIPLTTRGRGRSPKAARSPCPWVSRGGGPWKSILGPVRPANPSGPFRLARRVGDRGKGTGCLESNYRWPNRAASPNRPKSIPRRLQNYAYRSGGVSLRMAAFCPALNR